MNDAPRNELADFLSRNDTPCPNCGYNLRGLTSNACPECNQGLELRIGLTEPRIGLLMATAAALLTGAGAAGALLFFVVLLSFLERGFPRRAPEVILLLVYPAMMLGIEGSMAIALMRPRGRRWFRGGSESSRVAVVWGAWLLTLVLGIVWFSILWKKL